MCVYRWNSLKPAERIIERQLSYPRLKYFFFFFSLAHTLLLLDYFFSAYVCKIRMEVLRKSSFLPTASEVFVKHLSRRWITHFKVILKSVRGKLPTINCTKRQKCLFILVLFNIVSLWGSKVLMLDNFSLWQNCFFHYLCAEFFCSPCSRGKGPGYQHHIVGIFAFISLPHVHPYQLQW